MSNSYDMPDRAVLVTCCGVDHVIGVWDHAAVLVSSYAHGIDAAPTAIVALDVLLASSTGPAMRATVEYERDSQDDRASGESVASRALRALGAATLHPWSPPGVFTMYGDDALMSFLLGPCLPSTQRTDEGAVYAGGPLR